MTVIGRTAPPSPIVSVLMLAYNHGPYLARAIESVLGQRGNISFELLIGEDCSGDDTLAVARAYERQHPAQIRVLASQVNVGMHANHERLVRASRGRYIAYCEGDDFWSMPEKLARQVDFLERHPEYAAIHTEFSHLIGTSDRPRLLPRFNSTYRGKIPCGDVFDQLLVSNFIQTCTLVARADLVRDYMDSPWPAHKYAVEDWPMCLHLSRNGKVAYMDEPTATYRRVPGSVTNLGAESNLSRVRDQVRMVEEIGAAAGVDERHIKGAVATTMRAIVDLSLMAGRRDECRSAVDWLLENRAITNRRTMFWALKTALIVPGPAQVLRLALHVRARLTERRLYAPAS